MNLDFLKDLSLPEPEKAKTGKVKVELQGDFRIYRNGTFQSAIEEDVNHYAEIIFSKDLFGYPEDKPAVMFIRFDTEKFSKFDFETTKKSTFLKKNFAKIAEFFGLDAENTSFIDFNKLDDYAVTFPKAFIGKTITKGANKGGLTYVERENITLIPIENVYPVAEDDIEVNDEFTPENNGYTDNPVEVDKDSKENPENWVKDTSGDLRDGM